MRRIYLDHAATTPLDPSVLAAMQPYFLEKSGNASSIHAFGREARAGLDEGRDAIALTLGALAAEIVFVGGGTESDNFALIGSAWYERRRSGKNHIITSKAEHHAVLESCEFLAGHGFSVTLLDVDEYGMVDPDAVKNAVTDATSVVSIMHANNEVGTINPISEIADIAHRYSLVLHSDIVQTYAKLPYHADDLHADLLSFSAHKFYGPKGIGCLYVRRGTGIERFHHGGAQERGRRGGTENVPLAVGMAAAAKAAIATRDQENQRLTGLRHHLRERLRASVPNLLFNGHPDVALPHIVNVSFDHRAIEIDGEALLFNLDLAGVAVSGGSACTSGSVKPSHVLLAMGKHPATAKASVRFSMGRTTTVEDLDYAVDVLSETVGRIGTVKRPRNAGD